MEKKFKVKILKPILKTFQKASIGGTNLTSGRMMFWKVGAIAAKTYPSGPIRWNSLTNGTHNFKGWVDVIRKRQSLK